jgi:uncharacterized membrane protein
MKYLNPLLAVSQVYKSKTEVERMLLLSCLFSVAMSLVRVAYTNEWMFCWLIWNLFLGFIPFLISRFVIRRPGWIESHVKFAASFILWLLFIPNSFYIITDLFHLEARSGIPLWFDLALIFSYAWNGLLLGILSLRQMEKMISVKWQAAAPFFIFAMMCLIAFGVYIGRYLRYNSWDVVTHPFQLAEDIIYLLIHPIRNRFDWSMIVCYTVFMLLLYYSLKKLGREIW